jgi:hypothetical protein
LIDNGSQINLLSRCVVSKEEFYDAEHTRALKGYWSNVQSCGKKQCLMEAVNEWGQAKRQLTSFNVTKDQERITLLGLLWLQKVNSVINWKNASWIYPLNNQKVKLIRSKKELRKMVQKAKVALILTGPSAAQPTSNSEVDSISK